MTDEDTLNQADFTGCSYRHRGRTAGRRRLRLHSPPYFNNAVTVVKVRTDRQAHAQELIVSEHGEPLDRPRTPADVEMFL